MSFPFVAVFCGARRGRNEQHARDAEELGRTLVAEGAGLVFGGGHVGLMGVVADAVLAAGGQAYGVIPRDLEDRELAHRGLTRLDVVGSMHERKALIAAAAKGFIALPGGYGTLDELFEIVTWKQLRHHAKPVVLFDRTGYFEPLLVAASRMEEEGFAPSLRSLLRVERSPRDAVRAALGLKPE